MPGVLSSGLQYVKRFFVRRLGLFILFALLLLLLWLDRYFNGLGVTLWIWHTITSLGGLSDSTRGFLRNYSVLLLLTLFLAFSNLFLKISTRAPDLQRRLSFRFFRNLPFLIYFSVYFFLAMLAFHFFLEKNTNWFLAVAGASLAGIAGANADIKFGGFSLQPLADFLAALEAVVEASISTRLNESNIAQRASLRDQLIDLFDASRLEQECILIGHAQAELAAQATIAGSNTNDTYKGLLAVLIIVNSEANARRLIAQSSGDFFRLRFG